jgi:hypothetical protein
MPLEGILYPWDKINIQLVKDEPATYGLYYNDQIIFIGCTKSLSDQFQEYWENNFNNDPRKKKTNGYKREYREDHSERKNELLEEYEKMYGNLPECNE